MNNRFTPAALTPDRHQFGRWDDSGRPLPIRWYWFRRDLGEAVVRPDRPKGAPNRRQRKNVDARYDEYQASKQRLEDVMAAYLQHRFSVEVRRKLLRNLKRDGHLPRNAKDLTPEMEVVARRDVEAEVGVQEKQMQRVLNGTNPMTLAHLTHWSYRLDIDGLPPLEQDWQLPPVSRVLPLDESYAEAPDIYDWTLRFAYGIEE